MTRLLPLTFTGQTPSLKDSYIRQLAYRVPVGHISSPSPCQPCQDVAAPSCQAGSPHFLARYKRSLPSVGAITEWPARHMESKHSCIGYIYSNGTKGRRGHNSNTDRTPLMIAVYSMVTQCYIMSTFRGRKKTHRYF